MNAPRELICFGEDWGRHPSTAQYLVQQLLGAFRVIWINSLGWRTPRLSRHDVVRALSKVRSAARGAERPHPNLTVYTPLVIPWYGNGVARRLNAHLLRRAIAHLAQQPTLSIGVAERSAKDNLITLPALLAAADAALYEAKKSDRDCIKVYSPAPAAA